MKTKITGFQAVFAKTYKVEENSGTYIYGLGELVDDAAKIGVDLFKVLGDFSLLERIRGQLPCTMDLDVELVSGGGDKMVMRVIDYKITGKSQIINMNAGAEPAPKVPVK